MRRAGSLKLRLMLGAGLAISLSLLVAGLSFYVIFQRYVERAAVAELENHFVQLAASVRVDNQGVMKARTSLSDPRFQKPYGGLYWQINDGANPPLRSRSLFDDSLPLPDVSRLNDAMSDVLHIIRGPENSSLFAVEKNLIVVNADAVERKLSVTIAIDRRDIDETVRGFGRDLWIGLGLLYAVLLSGAFLQIVFGLRPLESLRRSVEATRKGTAPRVEGGFPTEVEPLVLEVNGLLWEREMQLAKARQRASNLAHGLKTPLTVLGAIADNIETSGAKEAARDIRESADQMRMLVERELARARMATGNDGRLIAVRPIVERMLNALKKTSQNDSILWHSSVPDSAFIAMEPEDFLECLGNLMENASKWAKSQIYVSWFDGELKIEDDGPGVAEDKLSLIMERGVRLDETVAGTGLGLSIVNDIIEAYGMELKLGRSGLGGLGVVIGKKLRLQN